MMKINLLSVCTYNTTKAELDDSQIVEVEEFEIEDCYVAWCNYRNVTEDFSNDGFNITRSVFDEDKVGDHTITLTRDDLLLIFTKVLAD